MKTKLCTLLVAMLLITTWNFTNAQGLAVTEDNSVADPSAILDVKSTTKGMLIPRMTSGERLSISSPVNGLIVYDTDFDRLYYYDGASWSPVEETNASSGLNKIGDDLLLGGILTSNAVLTTSSFDFELSMSNTLGTFKITNGGIERLSADYLGNVNVGGDMIWKDGSTSSTLIAQLIDDSNDGQFILYENGGTSVNLDANTAFIFNEQGLNRDFRVESDGDAHMLFVDASTNRVGIGTSSPDYDLQVEATNATIGLNNLEISNLGSDNMGLDGDVVPFGSTSFDVGNNTAGEHWDDMVANSFVTFSDKSLKQNIDPLKIGLKEIMALKPVSYQYIKTHDPAERDRYGLVAQDVEQIIPQVVRKEDVDVNPETGEIIRKENSHLSMNYMELIPVLINGMQEQQAIIEQLQAEIEALKNDKQ